jgi:hypothetical protein
MSPNRQALRILHVRFFINTWHRIVVRIPMAPTTPKRALSGFHQLGIAKMPAHQRSLDESQDEPRAWAMSLRSFRFSIPRFSSRHRPVPSRRSTRRRPVGHEPSSGKTATIPGRNLLPSGAEEISRCRGAAPSSSRPPNRHPEERCSWASCRRSKAGSSSAT